MVRLCGTVEAVVRGRRHGSGASRSHSRAGAGSGDARDVAEECARKLRAEYFQRGADAPRWSVCLEEETKPHGDETRAVLRTGGAPEVGVSDSAIHSEIGAV